MNLSMILRLLTVVGLCVAGVGCDGSSAPTEVVPSTSVRVSGTFQDSQAGVGQLSTLDLVGDTHAFMATSRSADGLISETGSFSFEPRCKSSPTEGSSCVSALLLRVTTEGSTDARLRSFAVIGKVEDKNEIMEITLEPLGHAPGSEPRQTLSRAAERMAVPQDRLPSL